MDKAKVMADYADDKGISPAELVAELVREFASRAGQNGAMSNLVSEVVALLHSEPEADIPVKVAGPWRISEDGAIHWRTAIALPDPSYGAMGDAVDAMSGSRGMRMVGSVSVPESYADLYEACVGDPDFADEEFIGGFDSLEEARDAVDNALRSTGWGVANRPDIQESSP